MNGPKRNEPEPDMLPRFPVFHEDGRITLEADENSASAAKEEDYSSAFHFVQLPPEPESKSEEAFHFCSVKPDASTEETCTTGQFEREESRLEGASESRYARTNTALHQAFLEKPCPVRGDALRSMTPIEQMIFNYVVAIRPANLLQTISRFPQKSAEWKWARNGRITGSATGPAIGYHRKSPALKAAWASIYTTFKGCAPTEWGSGKEVYAVRCYIEDLNRLVSKVFRAQRKSGIVAKTNTFVFRGQTIPVPDINCDPIVSIRHYGLLIDPWNHFRGVSPDGIIVINGVVAGCLEVKCPFGKQKSLYPIIPKYYFSQLQCEMYISRIFWPDVRWLDFVVWSPYGWTCETVPFEEDWFNNYYAPRELRYYFSAYLPLLAEKCFYQTKKAFRTATPTMENVATMLARIFAFPTSKSLTTAPKPVTTAPKPVTTAPKPVTTAPKPVTTISQTCHDRSQTYRDRSQTGHDRSHEFARPPPPSSPHHGLLYFDAYFPR